MIKFGWVIVGSGGHGREVAAIVGDYFLETNDCILGFVDDDPGLTGKFVKDLPVLGPIDWIASANTPLKVAMGIGSSKARESVVRRIKHLRPDTLFPVIKHPGAIVGPRVTIGEGTLLQAGCILTCDIEVGPFAVLNVGVSLSHDSRVGPFATLAPGSRLAGGASVGFCSEIGMGTHIIQNRKIGDGAQTGALAAVISDFPEGITAVGVPARQVRSRY